MGWRPGACFAVVITHLAGHRRAAAVRPAQRPASGAEAEEADPGPRGARCPAWACRR